MKASQIYYMVHFLKIILICFKNCKRMRPLQTSTSTSLIFKTSVLPLGWQQRVFQSCCCCHQKQLLDVFFLDSWPVVYSPNKEAEEAEECVHEPDIVGDAGDDCLLTVRTHGLHRRGLEHFPLQYGHGGCCSWRGEDGRCVTSHVDKVTGTGTHLSWHRVGEVTGWRVEVATCTEGNYTY